MKQFLPALMETQAVWIKKWSHKKAIVLNEDNGEGRWNKIRDQISLWTSLNARLHCVNCRPWSCVRVSYSNKVNVGWMFKWSGPRDFLLNLFMFLLCMEVKQKPRDVCSYWSFIFTKWFSSVCKGCIQRWHQFRRGLKWIHLRFILFS